MQELTEDGADAPNLNLTVVARRKAAKRTLPWDLGSGELDLVSPRLPQAPVLPTTTRKKRRLEEPFVVSTDEAARKTASPDTSVDTEATWATGRWTTDEDAQLTSATANTSKKKWGNNYMTDWDSVAALVPSRTIIQCRDRWKDILDPNIDRARERTGKWTKDEDIKLKDAVKRHGGKNWDEIAALVPGGTKNQCCRRWHNGVDSSIEGMTRRTGKWAEDQDIKLKDSAERYDAKNWKEIAALFPVRTKQLCRDRWHNALYPSIDDRLTGKWEEDEDNKLKDAVQTHGGQNWVAIAAQVPGRTRTQYRDRWRYALVHKTVPTTELTDKWAEDEDIKLKDAVQTYGDKDWVAISAQIPGRTKVQCYNRWNNILDCSINQANGLTGTVPVDPVTSMASLPNAGAVRVHRCVWTPEEDAKLTEAVEKGEDWVAVAALVDTRTKIECRQRWDEKLGEDHDALDVGRCVWV
jgi:hypothetical protein